MKSTKHLLHPELQVMAEASIITEINDENLQGIRETLDGLRPPLEDEKSYNVTRKEIFIPQDNARATIWPGRRPEDGEIHLKGSVYDAEKLIRAVTHPYPGAFYFKNGIKHTVWLAKIVKNNDLTTKYSTLNFYDGFLLILKEAVENKQ